MLKLSLQNVLYFESILLKFQGPKGSKGDQGSPGPMGQKGEIGEVGMTGLPVCVF